MDRPALSRAAWPGPRCITAAWRVKQAKALTGSVSQALLLYGKAAAYSDLALSARARLGRALLLYQAGV